jgi:paired amphipathic helix protein Sin3a
LSDGRYVMEGGVWLSNVGVRCMQGFAIREVKAQVAQLFKGHEDLLGEFSNFLPEPGSAGKGAMQKVGSKKKGGAQGKDALAGLLGADAVKHQNLVKSLQALRKPGQAGSGLEEIIAQMNPDSLTPETLTLLQQQNPSLLPLLQQHAQGAGGPGKEGKSAKAKKSGADAAPAEVYREAVLLEKLKKKLVNLGDNCYNDFLKCLGLYVQDVLSANELITVLEDMMGGQDVRDVFDELKVFLGIRAGPATKYRNNVPMSEIDFTNCPSSGVSYRSVPRDYPLPSCTGRTELCDQTLNDEWVSVPSGSEDFSYSHYRKNQYEESLFKCEDDRFELDMLIETNASTMRIMQGMLEDADKDRNKSAKLALNPLKAVHLKAVERVYGDHGPEMVEHLKRAPRIALGVVLPRLKLKDEEWRKARRDMNKIWRDVYKDNYYKSLDHRSFYFKQVDNITSSKDNYYK